MDVWLERLSNEMESAVFGMELEQLEWSPSPGKWNAANILEHLARAFGGTAKGIEDRLSKSGDSVVPAPKLNQRAAIFAVTALGIFPRGRKAPTGVEPTGADADTSLARFRENVRRMDRALSAAADRWGAARVAVHPILGPMTVHEWRRFHFIHTHHHVKQVWALRERFTEKSKAA